jgi:hypothetical protein
MDDDRRVVHRRRRAGCPIALAVAAVLAVSLTGCSLFVMAGKMLLGDPQVPSAFKQQTGVDLVRDQRRVLVVCTAPAGLRPELASLRYDLVEHLTRRMKRAGIDLIDGNEVANWMDRNGGWFEHASDLAGDFEADYIIHVEITHFTTREENSPSLFRGRASGDVLAYAVTGQSGSKTAHQVFSYQFNSEYPKYNPEASSDISSERVFVRRCVDRLSAQLAQVFYDTPVSERVF